MNYFYNLIYICLNTLSYFLLLYGIPFGNIIPSRGPKHGDPLSPYLFIIGAEALSKLLLSIESYLDVHGIKITKNSPTIIHLLYVNDLILLFQENCLEVGINYQQFHLERRLFL